jgi:cell division protein ZapA (FtsZ GTPase activity inhibitor)
MSNESLAENSGAGTPLTAEIRLLGERIKVRTADNDPEFAAEVIELVSKLLNTAETRIKGINKSGQQVTLLALLDLAEEYVRAKKRTAQFKAEIEQRTAELQKRIETS